MDNSRRDFLWLACGSAVLGIGGGGVSLITAKAQTSGTLRSSAKTTKRWAMAIDTKKCAEQENCSACIAACHKEHNVPDIGNAREEVKWLWKEPLERLFPHRVSQHTSEALRQRPVLTLCHHCDNPPCVRVCPTDATWKQEDGLVMMDQHRCIGCRYCMVACPYGARSFNWKDPKPHIDEINPDYPTRTKGVVEKCSMCPERLARGLEPACVEACKSSGAEVILFGDLNDPASRIRKFIESTLPARPREELGTRPQVYYTL